MTLYVVIRGTLHPFDAPNFPAVRIVGWEFASSAEEAAVRVANQDAQHDYYTAAEWHGHEWKVVLYVPDEGVDTNPPRRANRMTTWDILIPSIVHRTDMLIDLLEELERQLVPGVGVLVYRDNREQLYGPKCQRLYDSSRADYVSMLDDDDWVSDDYIPAIMEALEERPDYVGYKVLYTEHGVPQVPVIHSLQHYAGWLATPEGLFRDICHKNPLRRDLALQAKWVGDGGADIGWADQLRQAGCVKTEVYIDRELYHYRSTGAYSSSGLAPMVDPPPRPDADWVTWVV